MPEQITNNASSVLTAALNNSATSFTVSSASAFPTGGNFRIVIDQEIMIVTGVSSNTFTVTRGAESTTAAAHAANATVLHIITTGGVTQYFQDMGGCFWADRKPSTAGAWDEEFEGTANNLPTNWSWSSTPSGSDEWTLNSRWPSLLTVEGTGSTGYSLIRSNVTATQVFGIWCKGWNSPVRSLDTSNFRLYAENATGSESMGIELRANAVESPFIRGLSTTGGGGETTDFGTAHSLTAECTAIYLGLTRDASNVWRAWYSNSGIAWQKFTNSSSAHGYTIGRFRILMGTTGEQTFMGVDWIRYRTDNLFPRP